MSNDDWVGAILIVAAIGVIMLTGSWMGRSALDSAITDNLCPNGGKVEDAVIYCKTDGGYEEVVW